jgi:hypothetical protein
MTDMSMRTFRPAILVVLATGGLMLTAGNGSAQCQKGGQSGTSGQTGSTTSSTNTASARQQGGILRQQQQLQNALRRQQQQLQQQQQQQQMQQLQQQLVQQQILIQNLLQQQQQQPQITQQTSDQTPSMSQTARQAPRQSQIQRTSLTQPAPVTQITREPEEPEDSASRQLYIARQLANDAETARQEGKTKLATRLTASAEERLQRIVSKYEGTVAANTAGEMLKKIQ